MGRDGRALGRLDRLVPPRHAHDRLRVSGIPKALDVHVLHARPHAQRVVLLRQWVHKRRLAKRFGACTVGTAAVGVVLLHSAPLKYRCLRMSHWNSHMVVLSSTNPNALAVAKAFPSAYRTMKARTAWLHVICTIYGTGELPVTCSDQRERVPSPVFGHLLPIPTIGKEGDQAWGFVPHLWVLVHGKFIVLVGQDCPCPVALLGKGGRPCETGISLITL